MKRLISAFILISISVFAANAEDAPVESWFKALREVDRGLFERILADDVRIVLKEIQVIQTKGEFLESLDNWETLAQDLDLSFDADRRGRNEIVTQVCYKFENSSFTNLETFTIEDGKIVLQVQEKLRDGC